MPRTVDTPREAIIEQVRPFVDACYVASGRSGSGRVRIVLRLQSDGSVKSVDATATGTLARKVATCSASRIRGARLRMEADTPRFLSFPVVLPKQ